MRHPTKAPESRALSRGPAGTPLRAFAGTRRQTNDHRATCTGAGMSDSMTGAQASSARSRRSAPRSSSASPAARSCRRTTRCSTPRGPPRPGPPRAGRRARGGGLRAGHRQGRRLHGDLRPGRDQPGHPDRRRLHGLGADRRDHRPGQPAGDRHRRLPGGRHLRHHDARSPSTTSWCSTPPTIPQTIAEAFHLAATGRPGPVLVDIPKDVLQAQTNFSWPPRLDLPGYQPVTKPHGKQIREAARLIVAARRPVLYVGGGVLKARATTSSPSWPS